MKEIIELGKTITSRGDKNISLFNLKDMRNEENKEFILFSNAISGKYSSDHDAIIDIYKDAGKASSYRMLKSRLKIKLHNHIYFLNLDDLKLKPAAREEIECQDLLFKASKLSFVNNKYVSINFLNKALEIGEKFEFTDQVIQCLRKLRLLYSDLNKTKEFYKVQEKLSHYNQLMWQEEKAADIYFSYKIELRKSVKYRTKHVEKLAADIIKLKELWKASNSYNIFEQYYRLSSWHMELSGNYTRLIKLAHETEELFQKKVINNLRFDHRYNKYTMIYGYLNVREYKVGLYYAAENKRSFSPSSLNWFAYMEHYFLLAMHAENYVLATDLINEVEANTIMKKISTTAIERWHLYKAYLYFIYPEAKLIKKFSYQKTITSVPEYSKDKLGFNIAILILQFLHFLRIQDYDALHYRIESMRKYSGNYFSGSVHERSRCLFRLFMILYRTDFDTEVTRKKGQYYYKKLKTTSPPGSAYAEIEIIPYELIWKMILHYAGR